MPRIFMSYRKQDSEVFADRIFERLVAEFGATDVFRDVASIQPGQNWRAAIRRGVVNSDVLLVLIGPHWLEIMKARADKDVDWVRFEVQMGLDNQDITRVIPVLLQDTDIPAGSDLPDAIKPIIKGLTSLQAMRVRTGRDFDGDMAQLIAALRAVKSSAGGKEPKGLLGRFLSSPVWAGIAGIIAIFALVVAIMALPQLQGAGQSTPTLTATTAEASATPEPETITPTPSATLTETATSLPTEMAAQSPMETATPPPTAPVAVGGYPCEGTIISNTGAAIQVRSSRQVNAPGHLIQAGSVVTLRELSKDGWYLIEYEDGSRTGWVPVANVSASEVCSLD